MSWVVYTGFIWGQWFQITDNRITKVQQSFRWGGRVWGGVTLSFLLFSIPSLWFFVVSSWSRDMHSCTPWILHCVTSCDWFHHGSASNYPGLAFKIPPCILETNEDHKRIISTSFHALKNLNLIPLSETLLQDPKNCFCPWHILSLNLTVKGLAL